MFQCIKTTEKQISKLEARVLEPEVWSRDDDDAARGHSEEVLTQKNLMKKKNLKKNLTKYDRRQIDDNNEAREEEVLTQSKNDYLTIDDVTEQILECKKNELSFMYQFIKAQEKLKLSEEFTETMKHLTSYKINNLKQKIDMYTSTVLECKLTEIGLLHQLFKGQQEHWKTKGTAETTAKSKVRLILIYIRIININTICTNHRMSWFI